MIANVDWNLKKRIETDFGDQISFLRSSNKKGIDIIVSKSVGISGIKFAEPSSCIEATGNIICQESMLPDLQWPLTVEELIEHQQRSPQLLLKFLQEFLLKKYKQFATWINQSGETCIFKQCIF